MARARPAAFNVAVPAQDAQGPLAIQPSRARSSQVAHWSHSMPTAGAPFAGPRVTGDHGRGAAGTAKSMSDDQLDDVPPSSLARRPRLDRPTKWLSSSQSTATERVRPTSRLSRRHVGEAPADARSAPSSTCTRSGGSTGSAKQLGAAKVLRATFPLLRRKNAIRIRFFDELRAQAGARGCCCRLPIGFARPSLSCCDTGNEDAVLRGMRCHGRAPTSIRLESTPAPTPSARGAYDIRPLPPAAHS